MTSTRRPSVTLPSRPAAALVLLVGAALLGALVPLMTLTPAAHAQVPGRVTAAAGTVPSARAAVRTTRSWNRHVRCRAVVTTLSKVLGNRQNRYGGATLKGGAFKPGIPDKRAFRPPCRRGGVSTFIQLNRVKIGSCRSINEDGDWTCELTDPTVRKGRPLVMSQIHIETDRKFRTAGGWRIPPGGKLLDVQGFVYWDPGHTSAAWHHYSGWEIHSFTAWRRSPKR